MEVKRVTKITEVKYNIGGGKEITAEYDENGIMEITRECFEMLIEKRIPIKAIKVNIRSYGVKFYCPVCNVDIGCDNYCHNCGQKIDWGNENDRAD